MSLFDGLTPTYIFRIQVELEGKMVLDTSITTKDSREDLIKTKKTVRRLLDEYAPLPPVLTPAPDIPPTPESEAQDPAADQRQDEQPEEAPAPAGGGGRLRISGQRVPGDCSGCTAGSAATPSAHS